MHAQLCSGTISLIFGLMLQLLPYTVNISHKAAGLHRLTSAFTAGSCDRYQNLFIMARMNKQIIKLKMKSMTYMKEPTLALKKHCSKLGLNVTKSDWDYKVNVYV